MRFKIEEGNHLLVPVSIGVSAPRRNALNNMMEPVPDDVRGIGLIDTGASLSVVYRPIIEKLRLSARGFCSVYGFSLREGEDIKYPNYDISLAILDAVHDEQKIDDEVDRIEFRALQAVAAQIFICKSGF